MMICAGCGSTDTLESLQAEGCLSCCPERHMVTAQQLNDAYSAERARYREAHPHVDTKRLALPK